MNFLRLANFEIEKMLHIEEALMRSSTETWLISNRFTEQISPHIILGKGSKIDTVVHRKAALDAQIPVIRRFTGGGTVVTDHNTFFISIISSKNELNQQGFQMWPREIIKWSSSLFAPVFQKDKLGRPFAVSDTDYTFGSLKFGGCAQAISGQRFVHHTSFLWDFDSRVMERFLKLPEKQPDYRLNRSHEEFLCRLKHVQDRFTSSEEIIEAIEQVFSRIFRASEKEIQHAQLWAAEQYIPQTSRITTVKVTDL